ncbi:unnamed protein product [Brassicogethes aeneus]|uniref:HAT C-terminal dimerisation domain-containing protein n=1 Tax=Brassicogethes aeneus TaxID=1431903 RepID=A0A9P0AX10_BRAAE|nr:unnamed protein product [Brassicogethes aeneus]
MEKSKIKEIIEMILKDFIPISMVNNDGFKNFVKSISPVYNLPNQDQIREEMEKNYRDAKKIIQKKLNDVKYVGITIDVWESRREIGYITVSAHFIQGDKLYSYVLATRERSWIINPENIGNVIKKVIKEWNITSKVVGVMTKKEIEEAVTNYTSFKHIPCIAYYFDTFINEHMNNDLLRKCREHIIGIKNTATKNIQSIQFELHKIITYIESNDSYIWRDKVLMVEQLLKLKEPLNIFYEKHPDMLNFRLSEEDWKQLEKFQSFKSVELFYKNLFDDEKETFSSMLIIMKNFKQVLDNYKNSNNNYRHQYSTLMDTVNKLYKVMETNTIVQCSNILDPRYKTEGFTTKENKDKTRNQFSKSEFLLDAEKELDEYLKLGNKAPSIDPLKFWSDNKTAFPELYDLSLKYLCFPKTCILFEIILSKYGRLRNNNRKPLPPSDVDHILFLNSYELMNDPMF